VNCGGSSRNLGMYKLINEHCEAVVSKIAENDDVIRYASLQSDLRAKGASVKTDMEYQRSYRDYWRMNMARLSDRFHERYFDLLARQVTSKNLDIPSIALELWQADAGHRQSLQFSFATKLAHMVDPRLPVYDSFLAAFYFFASPSVDPKAVEKRLTELMCFYDFLRDEYSRVLKKRLLARPIEKFRQRFPAGEIPDERVVDWLLWAWVSLLRSKKQQHGLLLYD
jgi:hypothetical protein